MSREKLTLTEERRIRRWIRNILRYPGPQRVNEAFIPPEEDFMNAFVNPWMDVLKAAKVSAKSIGNALSYNLAVAFTFSPKKLEQLKKNYQGRQGEIDKETSEVMSRVNDSLAGGDAALIGFMINPMGYMATSAGFAAVDEVVEFAKDSGLRDVAAALIPGLGPAGWEDREPGPLGSILDELQGLFFIAHYAPPGPLMSEGDDEKKKATAPMPKTVDEALEQLFAGMEPWFEQYADKLIEAKQEQIDGVLEQLAAQLEPLGAIIDAKDGEELEAALSALSAAGIELEGTGAGQFGQQVEQEVERVMQDEEAKKEFVEKQQEELEKAGKPSKDEEGNPLIDEEQLRNDIAAIIFQNSKQGLNDQVYEGAPKLKQEALAILEDEEIEENKEVLQKAEKGTELLSIIDKAKKEIEAM